VSKYLSIQVTADLLSTESRIYTFEEGLWNIRGRYEKAFEEDDELNWSNVDGDYVTHILVVSLSFCSFIFLIMFGHRTLLEMSLFLLLLQLQLYLLFLLRLLLGRPQISIISSLWRYLGLILSSLTAAKGFEMVL
jgi:hypothetical protein